MPVIYSYVYQRGEYWFYFDEENNIFNICKDNNEKGFADIVGQTESFETAKNMVDEVAGLK